MLRSVLLTSLLFKLITCSDVYVETASGTVKGTSFQLPDIISGEKTINRYHGIPFAVPPVGDLRFRPPQPIEPWDDVFIADTLPDVCPQNFGTLAITHPFWTRFNEDCLYLSVFTPNDTSGVPYPTMVYLHGGAYTSGGSIQYPGHFLAGYDVVMVVPNYRVGHLGFISTGDEVAQGNWGFMDQVLALEWVRDNVAAFGGDPNQVTLFGQSAGASSIGLHMISPYSQGLFHQAVFESGNELTVWAINGENQAPETYTQSVAEQLGCPTSDSETMIECLRTIDAEVLIDTRFDCTPGYYCQGFAPVVDGDYIPMSPYDARDAGLASDVPILAGICREDGSPYTLSLVPEAGAGGFTREEFLDVMYNNLVGLLAPLFPDKHEEAFQALSYYYSPWPHIHNESLNRAMLNNMTTDFGFGIALDKQLKYQQDINDNIYMYIMGYRTKNPSANLIYPPWMGVPHSGELPYVIGFPLFQESWELRRDAQIVDVIRWDEEDQIWALYMMAMWTNFAKYGNPTPEPQPAPDNSLTSWPIWHNETQEYLYLDRTMEISIPGFINYEPEIYSGLVLIFNCYTSVKIVHTVKNNDDIDDNNNRNEYRQRNFAFWTDYVNYITGIDFGGEVQSVKPPSKKFSTESNKKRKVLSSKATEDMYEEFFKPVIEELMGQKIPDRKGKSTTN